MTWRHKQKIPYKKYLVILNIQRISFENTSTWQKHLSVFWSVFPCQYAIVEHTKKTFINVHNMKIDCIFNDYLSLKNIIKLTILNRNSSVIRQKGESQNWCYMKTKHAKFSEKRTFVTPWWFGKFGVFCFLETPVLRFTLLPYYRRILRIKNFLRELLNPCLVNVSIL